MDKFSREVRSRVMSAVRGRGNKSTELRAVALFRKHGITGWRRHLPLIGRPDFAFRDAKVAVFIDGCFWHGCARCYRAPKSSAEFWRAKITRNRRRDAFVARALKEKGWRVVRVKECQLKKPTRFLCRISRLLG